MAQWAHYNINGLAQRALMQSYGAMGQFSITYGATGLNCDGTRGLNSMTDGTTGLISMTNGTKGLNSITF